MRGLAGKRVVVTGGTSGIGEATSRRFLEEGARVVALAVGEREIETAHERLPGLEGALLCDVADGAQVERAFRRVDDLLGGVDVLVANAGISIRAPFLEIREEDWRRVLDVNLTGVFLCAQQAARRMVAAGGGTILMTASTNGLSGHPLYADYNASKAGVILLARTMALELAPAVRVNAVCPGYVLTPMQQAEYTPEMLAEVDAGIPLGRHARPDEVAALYAFLASDESAYLTGTTISIDGGETA
ncbi:MAG TPA: SDR family NAD(P)-dependent oxidoreductase [Gaiellaceae bacterium]|nr:SDR family NAD(P)-dependent oxidoreductase [Gaiellaceae bacterium]